MIDLIFIIVYIVVLFFYSKMLTVIVICSIPVYAILSAIVTPLFKKRLDEKFETGANTQSFLVESITGVQTVKSYALEPKFEKKWGDLQSDYVKASLLRRQWYLLPQELQDSLFRKCLIYLFCFSEQKQ